MQGGKFQIRNMTKDELSIAIYWSVKEGWNPGLYDIEAFYAADPGGFFIGLLDGKPVGTISAVSYGNYGFLSFYIVKPEYRKRGYGMKLIDKAYDYLKGKNIGADGVIENLKMYEKINLKLEHYNARYHCMGTGTGKLGTNIINLSKFPFIELNDYDAKVFGFRRTRFLINWISQPEAVALGFVSNRKLQGYGVVRKCYIGYKIAPIFAENAEIAENLFQSLRGQICNHEHIFLDVPEPNKDAVAITKKYKMKKVSTNGRIYIEGQPEFPLEKWYGITSFELG